MMNYNFQNKSYIHEVIFMGLLGISLLFVGIVLVSNGVGNLNKTDAKSMAFMNLATGSVIVGINTLSLLVGLYQNAGTELFLNVASGYLFGFTYLFLAANMLKGLDPRPFGWFSLCVAVFATVMAVMAFVGGNIWMGLLWTMWAVLWGEGFVEIVCKVTKLGIVFPFLAIFEGVFAAFVPAILMLLEVWPM
jgi:acid-activated urea channel